MSDVHELAARVRDGDTRALARSISLIEDRSPGYRDLVSALYEPAGDIPIIGITGSPGTGKSTLVDALTRAYRGDDLRVGVLAVDPSSPISGGAVLGDRVRMASSASDQGVFVRSMSTRGTLGGLSPAVGDAIVAYQAFGMDRILVETVGAGQNEVDVVSSADSIVVVLQPSHGDDVQMAKAGILEIGDIFVVNKTDRPGADRTVAQLREMLELDQRETSSSGWSPSVIETVATRGDGVGTLREELCAHSTYLRESSTLVDRRLDRATAAIEHIIRADIKRQTVERLERIGGIEALARQVVDGETDPYTLAGELTDLSGDTLVERNT